MNRAEAVSPHGSLKNILKSFPVITAYSFTNIMSLYQDLILDHYRNPRNQGKLAKATHHSEANNPTCGDKLQMDIIVKNDIIQDVRFSGSGCAISQASASLLTEYVKKKPVKEVLALEPKDILDLLGVALSPARLKCGLLSLETLHRALNLESGIKNQDNKP